MDGSPTPGSGLGAGGTAPAPAAAPGPESRRAFRLVLLVGAVSLFADLTYEGARSVAGPFLALLGARASVVALVAGGGEFAGYAARLLSGYLTDRTRRPWPLAFAGYAVNLLAVPLLALAPRWEVAAALIVAERLGKAIRTPPRDLVLSHAAGRIGFGWGFGLHEAMDQVGAVLGPLLVAGLLALGHDYRTGFAALLVPAGLALGLLGLARAAAPQPRDLEVGGDSWSGGGWPRPFRRFLVAAGCIAAGTADFPLIAFHLGRLPGVPPRAIPLLYALAMGVDGLAALVFGRLFDRAGVGALALAVALAAGYAPLAFGRSLGRAVAGMVLWGLGLGAQESVLRSAVAALVPVPRRGSAYGVFHAAYGLAWFAGSALLGVLYELSPTGLVACSVALQLLALPLLLGTRQALARPQPAAGDRRYPPVAGG